MVDHVKITRIADTVETMVNAVITSGMMKSNSTPTSINSVVNARLSKDWQTVVLIYFGQWEESIRRAGREEYRTGSEQVSVLGPV